MYCYNVGARLNYRGLSADCSASCIPVIEHISNGSRAVQRAGQRAGRAEAMLLTNWSDRSNKFCCNTGTVVEAIKNVLACAQLKNGTCISNTKPNMLSLRNRCFVLELVAGSEQYSDAYTGQHHNQSDSGQPHLSADSKF